MAKKYFRSILTSLADDKDATRMHNEKLDNYLEYGYPATNEDIKKDKPYFFQPDSGYKKTVEIEIHHQNTTSWMRAHTVNILTVLCCSDEPYEEK